MPKLVQMRDKDGNVFPKINRQMLTIECADHRQDHTIWTSLTVTNMTVKDGDATQLSLNNNGIRIGKGITKIMVLGNMNAGDTGTQNGDMTCEIWKNNENRGTGYGYKTSASYWASISSPLMCITVAEGDIIYLKLGGAITGSIRILNSYLTVIAL